MLPGSLLSREGAYRGAIAYLNSEVLDHLFTTGDIDSAEIVTISDSAASSVVNLDFQRDEQVVHDEL